MLNLQNSALTHLGMKKIDSEIQERIELKGGDEITSPTTNPYCCPTKGISSIMMIPLLTTNCGKDLSL